MAYCPPGSMKTNTDNSMDLFYDKLMIRKLYPSAIPILTTFFALDGYINDKFLCLIWYNTPVIRNADKEFKNIVPSVWTKEHYKGTLGDKDVGIVIIDDKISGNVGNKLVDITLKRESKDNFFVAGKLAANKWQ